jgi:hypothetical protein
VSSKASSIVRSFAQAASLGACTLVGFLAVSSPAQAECFGVDGPNTCTVFHPETASSVVDTGGFFGMLMGPTLTKARILFATNGNWQIPFTLSGITLKGDGITTSLAFPDLIVTPSSSWETNLTSFVDLPSPVTSYDYKNSKLSFTIPAGAANTSGNYSSISARILYADASSMGFASTTRVQSTAITFIPSPLPLMGTASAFAFSRKLRSRIRQAG